jgi:hypothetical protein
MEIHEKGTKSSARSDEMDIQTFYNNVHFELNYAKKGALYPPKADLPPLIEGSLFAPFLYELSKKGSVLN